MAYYSVWSPLRRSILARTGIPSSLLQCHERKMTADTSSIFVSDPESYLRSLNNVLRPEWNRILAICEEGMSGVNNRLLNFIG